MKKLIKNLFNQETKAMFFSAMFVLFIPSWIPLKCIIFYCFDIIHRYYKKIWVRKQSFDEFVTLQYLALLMEIIKCDHVETMYMQKQGAIKKFLSFQGCAAMNKTIIDFHKNNDMMYFSSFSGRCLGGVIKQPSPFLWGVQRSLGAGPWGQGLPCVFWVLVYLCIYWSRTKR